ncbi:IclR family transcriptional regulator C-terminal domain-containing protein [Streptomyces erythrochromogenes]|uniref:IclR family transcriptional regulator domain-containing protein n=1 Tax=Streptomyces erythrochromogenes TaxID=285574 RepID=UPI00362D49F9
MGRFPRSRPCLRRRQGPPGRFTPHTITSPEVFFDELDDRRPGQPLLDLQEYTLGTVCAAVPIGTGTDPQCVALSAHRLTQTGFGKQHASCAMKPSQSSSLSWSPATTFAHPPGWPEAAADTAACRPPGPTSRGAATVRGANDCFGGVPPPARCCTSRPATDTRSWSCPPLRRSPQNGIGAWLSARRNPPDHRPGSGQPPLLSGEFQQLAALDNGGLGEEWRPGRRTRSGAARPAASEAVFLLHRTTRHARPVMEGASVVRARRRWGRCHRSGARR